MLEYDYADDGHQPDAGVFAEFHNTVSQIVEAKSEVERLQAALEKAKNYHRTLETVVLPEMMQSMGFDEMKSGKLHVKIQPQIMASTARTKDPARHEQAMNWLDSHGHGGLVKSKVVVDFNREQAEEAQRLTDQLVEQFDRVDIFREVHPSTLKSWVKKELEAGREVPMDLFGVEVVRKAIIK